MRHENVFKEARSIATHCLNAKWRDLLRDRTDECFDTFNRFNISGSRDDFTELVARWTRMLHAMDAASPWVGGIDPTGGRLPAPRHAPLDALTEKQASRS